jgi:hypothetical protein
MRIPALCVFVVACLEAPAVLAACEMPALVASIPDGTLATEQELLAAQSEVQAYIAAMDQYIACQNEEMTADEEDTTDDYLFLMSRRIESAREEVDQVAADFNDQVNAFRAARQAAQSRR